MPSSATAYRFLLSAPGDVLDGDIATVRDAIGRWNAVYGRQYGAVVVMTHWKRHSAAEYGIRPQESLNQQLVDDVDILIAIFWHRLGTETGEAQSGTVEEIERAREAGAYVAILRSSRPVLPQELDAKQLDKLDAYCKSILNVSLMPHYGDNRELAEHVDAVLTRAVTRSEATAEAVAEVPIAKAEIWPRVERTEGVRTDSRGRIKHDTRWRLILTNTGQEPARRVRYELEAEEAGDNLPLEIGDDRELEVLPPQGEAEYGLVMHMGVAPQARCVVQWEDAQGEHENVATLRFF
jgi:hypothetical protein